MPQITKLSDIAIEIDELIQGKYAGKTFWITAEISNVRKVLDKRWCYVDFIERNEHEVFSMKGVIWNYNNVEFFESQTNTEFKNGIQITCKVSISFYKTKGYPQLKVLEIDFAHAIGQLELDRQKTLKRLIVENKSIKYLPDGRYRTVNNTLPLPIVIQRIALITAPNSDGQRDFVEVVRNNELGYAFSIKQYLTQVQGITASQLILQQLKTIEENKEHFDVVVIVRGGGSDTDFAAFNEYDLAKFIAFFPIPILTGIGHDRNTSIVDLMAIQKRTPTEVAKFIIDRNMSFEGELQYLKDNFFQHVNSLIQDRNDTLEHFQHRIKNLNPVTILKKGFAIIKSNNKIITDPKNIKAKSELQTILKNEIIHSTVTKKSKNEK